MSTTYAKWSDNADRWIIWDSETGESSQYTSGWFARTQGISATREYYSRFGVDPSLTDEELVARYETPTFSLNTKTGAIEPSYEDVLDVDPETNPALYWNGEAQDVAADRFYGRPLPESAGSLPRPA